jgi:hypothetical protein
MRRVSKTQVPTEETERAFAAFAGTQYNSLRGIDHGFCYLSPLEQGCVYWNVLRRNPSVRVPIVTSSKVDPLPLDGHG